jgi:hypothetical protein
MTDTHAGCRNDNQAFYEYQKKFYANILFPFIDKYKINCVIHLGDLVENKKQLNVLTLKRLREDFLDPMQGRVLNGLEFHILPGNHDIYYKDTNIINSLHEIIDGKYDFDVCYRPKNICYDKNIITMIPWISPGNREEVLEFIKNTDSKYCMTHLELKGFETQKGRLANHGDDKEIFSKFNMVFSGHYHIRSSAANIFYIGSCFQFNWSDYDDYRGFCVLDTETDKISYFENPYKMFIKYNYDEDRPEENLNCKDTYCRVNVINKKSESKFNDFINKIHEIGVVDLLIDEKFVPVEKTEKTIISSNNTIDIFRQKISSLDYEDKEGLIEMIEETYKEALEAE